MKKLFSCLVISGLLLSPTLYASQNRSRCLDHINERVQDNILSLDFCEDIKNNDVPNILAFVAANPNIKTLFLTVLRLSKENVVALAKTPLTELALNTYSHIGLDAIKALSQNTNLKKLVLNAPLSDAEAKIFADSTTLTSLTLESGYHKNTITDASAIALANNTHISELDLSTDPITDKGAMALANDTALKSLSLEWTEVGDAGVAALAQSPSLQDIALGQTSASAFAALAQDKNLTAIKVNAPSIGDNEAIILAQNQNLTSISLSFNKIGSAGAAALAALPKLTDLDLRGDPIGDAGLAAIAQNQTLTALWVGDKGITAKGAAAIAQAPSLTELYLTGSPIGDDGAVALAKNATIQMLDLSFDNVADTGIAAFGQNRMITELEFVGNKVTDKGVQALAQNSQLNFVASGNNPIGFAGILALTQNPHIQGINLNNSQAGYMPVRMTNKGAFALAADTHLRQLYAEHNQIGLAGVNALLNAPQFTFIRLSSAATFTKPLVTEKACLHAKHLSMACLQLMHQKSESIKF